MAGRSQVEDHDYRPLVIAFGDGAPGLERGKVCQRKADGAKRADLKKVASGNSVAGGDRSFSGDFEHNTSHFRTGVSSSCRSESVLKFVDGFGLGNRAEHVIDDASKYSRRVDSAMIFAADFCCRTRPSRDLGVVGNAGFRAGQLRGLLTSWFTRQECLGTCRQECRRYAATSNFEMHGRPSASREREVVS